MMPLPPPPPEPVRAPALRDVAPGELTPAWRVVFCIGWIGVVLVFAAVWKSGRTLGLAPWWLGPSGDPHSVVVNLIPFVLPIAAVVASFRKVRHLPFVGIVAAAGTAAVALVDLGRFDGIGAVELAAAAAGLLVSVASFAGMLRAARGDRPDDDATTDDLVSHPSAPVR